MKLDSKHQLVKEQVDMMYELIKLGENALKTLRKQCEHPHMKLVNYQWAPGHVMPNTKVCSVCGEVIPNLSNNDDITWTNGTVNI